MARDRNQTGRERRSRRGRNVNRGSSIAGQLNKVHSGGGSFIDNRPRLIMCVDARPKCGKTNLICTGPGDIVILNIDIGTEGVAEKFADDKNIFIKDWSGDYYGALESRSENIQKICKKIMKEFNNIYEDALHDSGVRTIGIETGTEVWEILKIADFGANDDILPSLYRKVNQQMRSLVKRAYNFDKYVIWTHHMSQDWGGAKKKLETWSRRGFSEMGGAVQAVVELDKEKRARLGKRASRRPSMKYTARIVDCRHNPVCEMLEPFETIPEIDVDQVDWDVNEISLQNIVATILSIEPDDVV